MRKGCGRSKSVSGSPCDCAPHCHCGEGYKDGLQVAKQMDGELVRRKPAKGPHGEVVGAAIAASELFCKVVECVKAVAGAKAFLVLPAAALHLSVVARGVGTDRLDNPPGNPYNRYALKRIISSAALFPQRGGAWVALRCINCIFYTCPGTSVG